MDRPTAASQTDDKEVNRSVLASLHWWKIRNSCTLPLNIPRFQTYYKSLQTTRIVLLLLIFLQHKLTSLMLVTDKCKNKTKKLTKIEFYNLVKKLSLIICFNKNSFGGGWGWGWTWYMGNYFVFSKKRNGMIICRWEHFSLHLYLSCLLKIAECFISRCETSTMARTTSRNMPYDVVCQDRCSKNNRSHVVSFFSCHRMTDACSVLHSVAATVTML